jgi:two-component system sensor histidine kinase CssS
MKNLPLVLKIWLVFAALSLCLFALIAFSLPWTLKGFFTEQIYDILLDSQKAVPKDILRVKLSQSILNTQQTPGIPASQAASPNELNTVSISVSPTAEGTSTASKSIGVIPSTSSGTALYSGIPLVQVTSTETSSISPTAIPSASATISSGPLSSASATISSTPSTPPGTNGQSFVSAVAVSPSIDINTVREGIKLSQQPAEPIDGLLPAATVLRIAPPANGPGIQHFVISQEGIPEPTAAQLPKPFVQAIEHDAGNQKAQTQTYALDIEKRTMFYVISKEQVEGNSGFMVSYAWGNYRNDLVMTMFWRLMMLMVVLIVISWLPCLWLARYLSRPLVLMEQQAGRMAERDWHEPFVLNRKDEMGRLAQAIESMRQRLVRQDKTQQFFLQNISHELKTPVMVIHSYAQSILDGVYPKGSISASVETIKSEAGRLEKRVQDLLYLNKLNYLATRERQFRSMDLSEIINECVERFRFRRPELAWKVELEPLPLEGEPDQWVVAIENVLDNQLRYAEREITVTLVRAETENGTGERRPSAVRIWNDGPQVEESVLATMFDQFQTGPNGQFGLGLAIVRQILAFHQADILVRNEDGGAAFYLNWGGTRPEA